MFVAGGEDGKKGNNFLIRKNGRRIRLPSKSSVKVEKGVSICICCGVCSVRLVGYK